MLEPQWAQKERENGSADTIFSQFSTISTSFLAHMVGEMAQKPLKCEEHIYSK